MLRKRREPMLQEGDSYRWRAAEGPLDSALFELLSD